MAITILEVKNCKYAKEDKSIINCEAKFSGLPESSFDNIWLPFTANPLDTEQHGKDIFANAEKGDYGEVGAHAHPSLEIEMSNLREERDTLLLETDWTQNADVPKATKDKFATYRQELRDLTEGIDTNTKARNVTWPTKPS
jgi:hypothetical protein